jgi:Thiamine pyrophosphate-requiring enzymes [acetolactate synthase, pyruvate dehydrogenase (cytochrome), glyoxylate carboligase, phosphonopyruvate decarboxylase]
MAFSLAAGMACSIAAPERDVITITGDGSLGMNLGELETIARVGANMTIIVNNDNAYGNIRQEENFKFGPRYYGVDLSKLNFAKIAKDLGCEAETITCAAELKDAMARSRSYKGPYLIDVKFNGNFSVWPEAY